MALKSVTEAAEELGLCKAQVRKKLNAGEWPYFKLGKKGTRLDVDEIKSLGRLIAKSEQERQSQK